MKKNRILISILASSILLSSCSNLFESFLNDDEKAKTGDDSLTKTSATASYENDESTNTEIDKGLVVIKSSRPSYNHITYSASQKDYVVGSDSDVTNGTKVYLTSLDNPVTFKCLTNDAHSTVEWTAVQTYESVAQTTTSKKTYTDTADSTKKSTITTTTITSESLNQLNTPVDLTSSLVATADSKNQIQTIDLPYGTTVVTAKVTADDPQYSTTYTITLTKRRLVGTTEKTSELKSLSVTPANTTNSDGTTAAVWDSAFTPDDRSYEVTVDEDCDELTFDFGTGAGVEVVSPLVAANKYGTVLESDYTVLLSGGRTTYTIPVKDSDGSVKTYSVTVVKPEDGDTSLQSFDCSPASSYANGVKSTKAETLKTDMGILYADIATATNGTFAYTASADNRVDVTSMSFIAVPTHKYTTVAYYVGDTCPDTADTTSDKWSSSYDKATELAAKNAGTYPAEATSITLKNDSANSTTTLWMKTTTKAYKHSLTSETKTSDVTYHKAVITKAGKGNTKLTALYAMADYQNDSDKSESKKVLNLTTDSEVAYQVPSSTQYTTVTTYADSITFYMRTLDKSDTDATKKITYTAVNTEYVSSANTSFTGCASTEKDVTTETINGLKYYKFTIGAQDGDSDTDTDLPDGKTTVTIYVDGTPASTMVYTKPDKNCTSLGGLGYTGAEGKGNNTFYIYIDNTVENVTLNSTTQQQDATITSSASYIEGTDGAAVTEATVTTKSVQVTSNPVEWTTTIGGTGTDALKEGKTKATLTVTNNGHTATYYVYIIKASDTETRLKTLTVDGTQVSGYDWDSDYSTDSTIYYVAHSTSEATLAATALSSGASIGVTNSSLFTSKDDAIAWDGTTSATTFIESAKSPVSKSTGALTGGYVVYDVKVSPVSGTNTRTYRIVMTVDLDMNAKLSTFTATQNGATSTYYNNILAGLSSETSYSKNASLDYTGDIVVNATAASVKATLGTPTVTYTDDSSTVTDLVNTGVTVDSTLYKATVDEDDKSIKISYALYNYYAGKSIVVTYTVTAEAGNTQDYVLTINIPELIAAVSPTTGTIGSDSSTYTYSVDYTRRMGYRFGSQRSDATYTDFYNKFGGIDVVGSNDNGSSWIVSSFKCSGWIYCLNIDGTDYWVTLGADGKSTALATTDGTAYSGTNITLTVTPSIKYEGTGADAVPYLILKHEVTNTSGKKVKLGAIIDTLVDTYSNNGEQSADAATITPTNYGFDMSNAGYKFSVILNNATGVDNVDNLWYGKYGKEDDCMWDNSKEAMKTSGVDTAVSYSWNGGATRFTKTIRMSLIAN